jgi:hypothetical protein
VILGGKSKRPTNTRLGPNPAKVTRQMLAELILVFSNVYHENLQSYGKVKGFSSELLQATFPSLSHKA